MADRKLQIKRL